MKTVIAVLFSATAFVASVAQSQAALLTFDSVFFPGNGSPLSVTGSDGTIFTFSYAVPGDSQFESFSSGGGSFPVGTSFLTPGLGRRAPVAISFSTPLHAVTIPVASVNGSNYVSTVSYYNGTTLLSSSSLAGNLANGAPRFRTDQLVTSALISLTSDSAFGYTSNIGPIGYSVSAVPLPPSLPMFGAAILGLGAFGYRMRLRGRTASHRAEIVARATDRAVNDL